MIEPGILPALHARLAAALAPPDVPLIRFEADGATIGAVTPPRARRLAAFADVFDVDSLRVAFAAGCTTFELRTAAMERVARALAGEDALTAWRDERYDVRADGAPAPAFTIERAAARYFGVRTLAAHVNGLVETPAGTSMWLARRSPSKSIDPGKLDNLVGGGIASGASVAATLVKEAWEEAGIDAALAASAQPVGTVHIRRMQQDGMQRETIHVHDLWLASDFVPQNQDGEVVEHRLVALSELPTLLVHDEGPDALTADASLVVLDALIRLGAIEPGDPLFPWLEALCEAGR